MNNLAGALFVAALSFEQRATHAFERMVETRRLAGATFIDYGTSATPGEVATQLREESWARASRLATLHSVPIQRVRVNPYAMGDVERLGRTSLRARDAVTFDISCMTRPHVLGIASACASSGRGGAWDLAYTRPWSYGKLDKPAASLGWRDSLLLSLGEDPSFSNEGIALGIFIPGSESDRAAVAFDTVEPASGVIVGVRQADRPDIYRHTLASNEVQTRHLLNLRMPGPRGEQMKDMYPNGRWVRETVDAGHLVGDVAAIARRVIASARSFDAPIILYPFGPKVAVFVAAYALAADYPMGSWAVYPVPRTHPLDYSDGARSLVVVAGDEIASASREVGSG